MSGAVHALVLLLHLHLRLMLRPAPGRQRGLPVWARLIAVTVIVLSVSFALAGFAGTIPAGVEGQAVLALLLPRASSWGSLLLFLFAIPVVLAALTYGSDLALLLLTPLSPRVILGEKFVMIYGGSALPLVLAGCVVITVLGSILGASPLSYVTALSALLLFPGLAVGCARPALDSAGQSAHYRRDPEHDARRPVAQYEPVRGARHGPALLIASCLAYLVDAPAAGLAGTWCGGTLLTAAVLGGVAVAIAARLFATGRATYQQVGRRARVRQVSPASRRLSLEDGMPAPAGAERSKGPA